jgi:hypothetical protein
MRIDYNGNVGIGTTSPYTKLQVNGVIRAGTDNDKGVIGVGEADATNNTVNCGLWRGDANSAVSTTTGLVTTGGNYLNLGGYQGIVFTTGAASIGSQTERMRIDSSGNLTIGTTDTSLTSGTGIKLLPSNGASIATLGLVGNSSSAGQGSYHLYSTSLNQYQFYVLYNGTIAARSGSITVLSDQSEKTNVRDLETGLNEVLALKPRRFDWINDQGTNIVGFIAQEVQTILPDLIEPYKISDEETKLGLKMGDMLPTLVNAIQEQQTIINDIKAELDNVKTELATLKGAAQ